MAIKIIFWVSLFIVFYTYLGYGLLLWILVKVKECIKKPRHKNLPPNSMLPNVTLFIAAYNEQEVIEAKMANSLAINYPSNKFTIMWVTDGSDDSSVEMLEKIATDKAKDITLPKIIVEHTPKRGGKAAAFNRGIEFVKSPIVVFTDANTMLNTEAVFEIVREFTDEKVGCVAGEKRVSTQMSIGEYSGKLHNVCSTNKICNNGAYKCSKCEDKLDAAATEGIYWKYESTLKALDYRLYSAVGAAGELFAVRTNLFEKLSNDTLLDDFILSMRIAQRGYKIAYCANAYAVEGTSANIKEEGKRKVRISAGGLQSIWRLLPLLNIFKYGILSFQYISHRVLRWSLTPLCLVALIPLNIALALKETTMFYIILFFLQILFYIMGIAGGILSRIGKKNKILYVVYYFLFMNYNVFKGIGYLIKKRNGLWEKSKRR
ncbi:MAG: glycosyltransferase family 2 protein [Bacteroidales bacterium]